MVTTRAALTAVQGKGKGKHGLKLDRWFTTDGVHPYDEVEWELRDAIINDFKTGGVAFEQRDVEFPKAWSMNATTIVAQKYFRGHLGSPERERSVRQMIDRVADTITAWGVKDGYFADAESAEIFADELKHLLVNQKAAFNSPVWFNVGASGRTPQCSACQPWDARVSTPDGLVPIGELYERNAVGTKVYDANGLTRVIAVKHNGQKQVLRLHLKAGSYLDVTPDHLVWKSYGSGSGKFVEAGELRAGDHLEWHRTYVHGEGEITETAIAEAALAGWLQSDGFVGQYRGTNKSLTIETMTVNDAERDWVLNAVDKVLPGMHRHERTVVTKDETLDCRRNRIYGEGLRDFVERWGLLTRGVDMQLPDELYTAPLPVVAAYLRSMFQAEGYVQVRERSARIGLDMISEDVVRGIQALLLRFGIFSRVSFKHDKREDRHGCWSLSIGNLGDRIAFRDEIGFLGADKVAKLEASLELEGKHTAGTKRLEIVRIEERGVMDVYDIQTESGEYLSGNLRVHNCFILSVEDQMSSILNWYVEEGTIFKGGSGSGVNLSKIRSSKERLSTGGTASGPVSFMRGADASAGTIKSGGSTRRAAKMVILNVDHPDVEEFIWCKQREELKARALREAGFDMDLDGLDSNSVQYQNANNSVRVTDEFMEAVEADTDFDLRAVTTGETVKTLKARDLMRQVAQAAWECADPGMQYDTTINDWHTTPNAGRINGSNPCSEYMHLDNSACNLASLNLRKFESGGVFDVEAFKRAVEVVFSAQEIIVGNSSYPTEKIAENARAYRQLGLGYANLGGLLMSQGLAYDSEEGRAWAAAITALMTGHAYRTSAELARVQGPFDGFAADRDGTLRVIAKHGEAAEQIDAELAPANILEAAKQSWAEALELGTESGIRNAQSSVLAPTGTIGLMMDCDTTGIEPDLGLVKSKKLVGGGTMRIVNQTVPVALTHLGYQPEQIEAILAYIDEHATIEGAPAFKEEHLPVFDCAMGERSITAMGHVNMMAAVQPFISGAISKCVTGESLVTTSDGLVRIGSLHRDEAPDSFRDEVIEVASLGGPTKTDAFYYGGLRHVREVVLRSGHRITGTDNHRVLVAGETGLDWRYLDEVQPGEYVAVQYGTDMWSPVAARFDDFAPTARYGSQKDVRLPEEMTEELAFLLGAYAAEGHTNRSTWTVNITNAVDGVLERVAQAWRDLFGVQPVINRPANRCANVVVASKRIVEFLDHLGCGTRASNKRVPDAVLRSPKPMVLAFLQGLSLDAYTSLSSMPKWAICLDSKGLLDDLQAVLTNLGIVHGRITKHNAEYDKDFDEVYAVGRHAARLAQLVPFMEPDKAARAALLSDRVTTHNSADIVPGVTGRELYELIPAGLPGRNGRGTGKVKQWRFLLDKGTRNVSRGTLERIAAVPGVVLPDWLQQVLDDDLHFSPVASVADSGEREVFDVSVPTTQAFVGNGIVNHNTVNLPESATVEDVEEMYLEGWKLGLKALAIYRDNCKVAQPLSLDKKKPEAVASATDDEAAKHGMVRRRLPKQRPSQTISFQVGEAEGYLTAGEYPGDGLGEIFVKLGKQGSTLSGVMDAFAISVSLGLQYGVPLEAYVKKFSNMRFEPSGMTDDPEVKFTSSLVDYIFRRLAIEYLPAAKRQELGIYTLEERSESLDAGGHPPAPQAAPQLPQVDAGGQGVLPVESPKPIDDTHGNAPMCYQCGVTMIRAGSCHCCPQCGATSGCS